MAHCDTTQPDLKENAVRAFKAMLLARAFDTKISSLYKAGKITGAFTWAADMKRLPHAEASF
ncbi:hypothetical protein M5E88_07285 [Akkermansia muciniphila]|nr:hypothetical protein M5E88_07285 [Akkermansia muciniphila]